MTLGSSRPPADGHGTMLRIRFGPIRVSALAATANAVTRAGDASRMCVDTFSPQGSLASALSAGPQHAPSTHEDAPPGACDPANPRGRLAA